MMQQHVWGLIVVVVLLLAIAAISIGCLVNPKWGIKHFAKGLRGGGELRRDWNELQMQLLGLVFAVVSLYMIYEALLDLRSAVALIPPH